MPDDANGVYSLPNGYLAVTGQTIQPSQHNPPLEDAATALSARLSRSGSSAMTGPLKAADGAVGAPSYSFNSAQTTGFYKTAGGNVGVSIAGTEVAEFGLNGMLLGGKFIGEVFDYSGVAAPPLCVLLQGQTLSRTTYAALWAFAQTQITAGTTFFNNGNGSTTFGIADLRGRVRAMVDGVVGRLTTATIPAPGTIGSAGGAETIALSIAQMPVHSHGVTDPGHSHAPSAGTGLWGNAAGQTWGGGSAGNMTLAGIAAAVTGISIQNNGSGTAHNNAQPTIMVNSCLFAGA